MLGDINIAEPKALIAFAGPRVVKDTTGKELPEGFQTSEFQLEKGFLDFISHRNELKTKISNLNQIKKFHLFLILFTISVNDLDDEITLFDLSDFLNMYPKIDGSLS